MSTPRWPSLAAVFREASPQVACSHLLIILMRPRPQFLADCHSKCLVTDSCCSYLTHIQIECSRLKSSSLNLNVIAVIWHRLVCTVQYSPIILILILRNSLITDTKKPCMGLQLSLSLTCRENDCIAVSSIRCAAFLTWRRIDEPCRSSRLIIDSYMSC